MLENWFPLNGFLQRLETTNDIRILRISMNLMATQSTHWHARTKRDINNQHKCNVLRKGWNLSSYMKFYAQTEWKSIKQIRYFMLKLDENTSWEDILCWNWMEIHQARTEIWYWVFYCISGSNTRNFFKYLVISTRCHKQ